MLSIMFSWQIHGYNRNINLLFPNMGVLAVLGRTATSTLTLASPAVPQSELAKIRNY